MDLKREEKSKRHRKEERSRTVSKKGSSLGQVEDKVKSGKARKDIDKAEEKSDRSPTPKDAKRRNDNKKKLISSGRDEEQFLLLTDTSSSSCSTPSSPLHASSFEGRDTSCSPRNHQPAELVLEKRKKSSPKARSDEKDKLKDRAETMPASEKKKKKTEKGSYRRSPEGTSSFCLHAPTEGR